ncbi:MAG TPA: hypothetical protein VF135_15115 [Terriglobales bacterium]
MGLQLSSETEQQVLRNARAQGLEVEDYLRWLMAEEQVDFIAAVEQGLSDVDGGRVRPAREALLELGSKLGFSR